MPATGEGASVAQALSVYKNWVTFTLLGAGPDEVVGGADVALGAVVPAGVVV